MSRWYPTVDEERQMAVRRRAEMWVAEGTISKDQRLAIDAAHPLEWKTFGVLAFAALFFLSTQAIATAYWFNQAILPFGKLLTAVGCIALAELLIVRLKWWSTGVEHALWLGGLFSLILSLPGEGKPEAILLFAAAAAIAGFRLRSAFLGTLGALLVVVYLGVRSWDSGAKETFSAILVAVSVLTAIAAVFALRHEWKRPSTELLWTFITVVIPPAALLISRLWDEKYLIAVFAAVLGAMLAFAGVRIRHHAPLISSVILFAAAGTDVVRGKVLATEALLAIFGATLLVGAFVISRALRDRTNGIAVTPSKLTVVDDAVETAAVFVAGPQQTDAPPETRTGGGSFGGAGATGEY